LPHLSTHLEMLGTNNDACCLSSDEHIATSVAASSAFTQNHVSYSWLTDRVNFAATTTLAPIPRSSAVLLYHTSRNQQQQMFFPANQRLVARITYHLG